MSLKQRGKYRVLGVFTVIFYAGCASTGVPISKSDLKQARSEIKAQSIDYYADGFQKIERVRFRLASFMKAGKPAESRMALPFWYVSNHPELQLHYGIAGNSPVWMGPLTDDAVETSSPLKRGDELVSMNGVMLKLAKDLDKMIQNYSAGSEVSFLIRRQFTIWEMKARVIPVSVHLPVLLTSGDPRARFDIDERGFVSLTDLLVKEIKSEDEMAAVIAMGTCQTQVAFQSNPGLVFTKKSQMMTPDEMLAYHMNWNSDIAVVLAQQSWIFADIAFPKADLIRCDADSIEALAAAGYDAHKAFNFWMEQAAAKRSDKVLTQPNRTMTDERLVLMEQEVNGITQNTMSSRNSAEHTQREI